MANLKDLKNRITSVKSTQKITKAMKMVAASKLRRAQERAENSRPYTEKLERMLITLASSTPPDNVPELLTGRRTEDGRIHDKTHLLIVVTSDRGLCGALNSSIVKEAKQRIYNLESEGKKVKIITIGKKGYEQLKYSFEDYIVERIDTADKKHPEYEDAEETANKVLAMYAEDQVDSCSVIYNSFVSALQQDTTVKSLIPLDLEALKQKESKEDESVQAVFEYEPEEEEILKDLLPRNIAVQIFSGILENTASEHGARMTAMDNATRNSGEMIDKLTLMYNRTRQAAITTELTEIISGAEAL